MIDKNRLHELLGKLTKKGFVGLWTLSFAVITLSLTVINIGHQTNLGSKANTPKENVAQNQNAVQTDKPGEDIDSLKFQLHRQTANLLKQFHINSTDNNTNRLLNIAKDRKDILITLLAKDPETALTYLLPDTILKQMDASVSAHLEKYIHTSGTLDIIHTDTFTTTDNSSRTDYFLTANDGRKYTLHLIPVPLLALESQDTIEVGGYALDNDLFVAGADVTTKGKKVKDSLTGIQKTAVILANYQNTTQPDFSTADIKSFFDSSIDPYYRENSYGNISIKADVSGWYTLPTDQGVCTDDTPNLVRELAIQAADPNIDFSRYNRLVIVAPFPCSNSWTGVSTLGSTLVQTADGEVTMSIAWIDSKAAKLLHVVGHELGHGFGNHHAGRLFCYPVSLPPYPAESCNFLEYYDYLDIMGYSSFHFNTFHKEVVGWLNSTTLPEITTSGTYEIFPIETNADGIKGIKIRRGDISGYLYVEYRQPIGFDASPTIFGNYLATGAYNGALIHIQYSGTKTAVLDMTPQNYISFSDDLILTPGNSFVDPLSLAKITTLSADENSLTINVELTKTDLVPPVITVINPPAYSTVNGTFTLDLDVTDNVSIDRVEVYSFNGALLETDQIIPYSFVLDSTQMPNGLDTLRVIAYDLSGNAKTIWISYYVENQDAISPSIEIIEPVEGGTYQNPVSFTVNATDNVGVHGVEFFITYQTGSIVDYIFDGTSPYSFLMVSYPPAGNYGFYAQVYDLVGNITTSNTVNFTITQ